MQPVVGRVSNRRRGLRDQLAVRGIRNDTTLCDRLLQEADVAILPGSAFGRSGDELTARLAYIDFHGRRLRTGSAGGLSGAQRESPSGLIKSRARLTFPATKECSSLHPRPDANRLGLDTPATQGRLPIDSTNPFLFPVLYSLLLRRPFPLSRLCPRL